MAFRFSYKLGICKKADLDRVTNLFKKSKLPTTLNDIPILSISTLEMIRKFKYDKKTKQGNLVFILNNAIGDSFIKKDIDLQILKNFINEEI